MATVTSIHPVPTADPAASALERLRWAERRRSAAATEARQARERLVAADEQVRQARAVVRRAQVLRRFEDGDAMVGMGFFADELGVGDAA